jgi:hypothetical protein
VKLQVRVARLMVFNGAEFPETSDWPLVFSCGFYEPCSLGVKWRYDNESNGSL